jgi:hypothetical protein
MRIGLLMAEIEVNETNNPRLSAQIPAIEQMKKMAFYYPGLPGF